MPLLSKLDYLNWMRIIFLTLTIWLLCVLVWWQWTTRVILSVWSTTQHKNTLSEPGQLGSLMHTEILQLFASHIYHLISLRRDSVQQIENLKHAYGNTYFTTTQLGTGATRLGHNQWRSNWSWTFWKVKLKYLPAAKLWWLQNTPRAILAILS